MGKNNENVILKWKIVLGLGIAQAISYFQKLEKISKKVPPTPFVILHNRTPTQPPLFVHFNKLKNFQNFFQFSIDKPHIMC